MAKIILKFVRSHGRYNAGEIAGFDKEAAARLTAGDKPIAKAYDAKAEKAAAAARAQSDEVLDKRAAELDAREKAMAEREAKLAEAEAKTGAGKGAGAPPSQGASK